MPDTVERHAALDALYAQLPALECRGKCGVIYCGAIDMTPAERDRIRDTTGITINRLPEGKEMCPALGIFGTCTVYQVRPAICRLWGHTKSLRCRFGCMPEGGWMNEIAGLLWLAEVKVAGGHWTPQEFSDYRELLRTSEGRKAAEESLIRAMVMGLDAWEKHHGRRHTRGELDAMVLREVCVD